MSHHRRKQRVGLLGGSFNPAHAGHVHISKQGLDLLGLDEVWWLVSPQNPLKSSHDMASLKNRMAGAQALAMIDKRIKVSDAESHLGTRFTVDTVQALKIEHKNCSFVWMIGADNLRQMGQWKGWRQIFRTVPVAVFPRAPYSLRATGGRVARYFAGDQISQRHAKKLVDMKPPAWVFLKIPIHGESATRIRQNGR